MIFSNFIFNLYFLLNKANRIAFHWRFLSYYKSEVDSQLLEYSKKRGSPQNISKKKIEHISEHVARKKGASAKKDCSGEIIDMKRNRFLKLLILGFVMAMLIGVWAKGVTAQAPQEIMLQSPLSVPVQGLYTKSAGWADLNKIDSILVDNFEYQNNPRNVGWTSIVPSFIVHGALISLFKLC